MCRKACPATLDCMWLRLVVPLPTHIRIPASSCMRVPEYVGWSGRTAPPLTPAALLPPTINPLSTVTSGKQSKLHLQAQSCRRTNISPVSKLTAQSLTFRRRRIVLTDQGRLFLGLNSRRHSQRSQVVRGTPQTDSARSCLVPRPLWDPFPEASYQPPTQPSRALAKMEPRARAGKNVGKANFSHQERTRLLLRDSQPLLPLVLT